MLPQAPPSTPNQQPTALARIIAQIEASGAIRAVRFEPLVFGRTSLLADQHDLLQKIADLNMCNWNTARVIYSTSFGLYQLMGYNIYHMGFDGPILQFWSADAIQHDYFERFLISEGINYSWEQLKFDRSLLESFAAKYNGPGGRVTYADAMERAATLLHL